MRSVVLLLAGAFAGCAAGARTRSQTHTVLPKGFEECTWDEVAAFKECFGDTVYGDDCATYLAEASDWTCYLQVPCVNAKDRMSAVNVDICTHERYTTKLKVVLAICSAPVFLSTIAEVRDRDCARTRKPSSAPTLAELAAARTSRTESAPSAAGKLGASFMLLAIAGM
jgi:hypothetical protein